MRKFSFFVNKRPKAGSSLVRGLQIVEYMRSQNRDVELNPASGFDENICIYVKGFNYLPGKYSYLDIVDSGHRALIAHNLITLTERTRDYLLVVTEGKNIRVVRQQHCNFEREKREEREVTTVGFVGAQGSLQIDGREFAKLLLERGLEFIYEDNCMTRDDVVNLYKKIDIQVAYRPSLDNLHPHRSLSWYKDSLKIYNAGSFGIPTVAYPDPCFVYDFKDYFVEARTMEEMADGCAELKNNTSLYKEMSEKILLKSEEYHISNIINDYYALDEEE